MKINIKSAIKIMSILVAIVLVLLFGLFINNQYAKYTYNEFKKCERQVNRTYMSVTLTSAFAESCVKEVEKVGIEPLIQQHGACKSFIYFFNEIPTDDIYKYCSAESMELHLEKYSQETEDYRKEVELITTSNNKLVKLVKESDSL